MRVRELKPKEVVAIRRRFLEQISPGDVFNYEVGENTYRLLVESVNGGKITGYEVRLNSSAEGRTRTRTLASLAKKDLSVASSGDFKKVLPPQ